MTAVSIILIIALILACLAAFSVPMGSFNPTAGALAFFILSFLWPVFTK